MNNNSALAQPYRSIHDMSPDVTIGDHYAGVPHIPQNRKRMLNRKMSKKLLAMRAINQMESGWSNTVSSNLGTFSQPDRQITIVRRNSKASNNDSNNGKSAKKGKKLRIRSLSKRKFSRQRLHTSISDSNLDSPQVNVRNSYIINKYESMDVQ